MPDYLQPGSPLLMAFHGLTGKSEDIQIESKFDDLTNEGGFVIVYPQGSTNSYGVTTWNVGYEFEEDYTVDDVHFAKVLSQTLINDLQLDSSAVFATGHSNGA